VRTKPKEKTQESMIDIRPEQKMTFPTRPIAQHRWSCSLVIRYLRQNAVRLIIIVAWIVLLGLFWGDVLIAQSIALALVRFLVFFLILLVFVRYSYQTFLETFVLASLIWVHNRIGKRISTGQTPTKNRLQSSFESLRQNFMEFVSQSTAALPLRDFMFEKLRKSIDLFFYAASSIVLSEKPAYYSMSDERRVQLEEESRTEESEPEAQMLDAQQAQDDEIVGHVRYFGLPELRSFVVYLADRLFSKERVNPFWIARYSVNLIDLLNFFQHWNELLSQSTNGEMIMKEAKSEVDQFYSETKRREEIRGERIWRLMSDFIVAIVSILIGFALGRL